MNVDPIAALRIIQRDEELARQPTMPSQLRQVTANQNDVMMKDVDFRKGISKQDSTIKKIAKKKIIQQPVKQPVEDVDCLPCVPYTPCTIL